MAEGKILILEGYDAPLGELPKARRRGNKNSPAARAAKACRAKAKGKGIMAPAYRACVKKFIKKHTKSHRRSR